VMVPTTYLSLWKGLIRVKVSSTFNGPAVLRRPLLDILTEVAYDWGTTTEDLRGPSRHRAIAHARQDYFYRAHLAGYGDSSIAYYVHRDHATAIYGRRAHEKRNNLCPSSSSS
jgi:chromosomal replication initiation ATPase DnaA